MLLELSQSACGCFVRRARGAAIRTGMSARALSRLSRLSDCSAAVAAANGSAEFDALPPATAGQAHSSRPLRAISAFIASLTKAVVSECFRSAPICTP